MLHCEGGNDPAEVDAARGLGLRRPRAGAAGTSSSAASPGSRSARTARSPPPATRVAAGTASSWSERRRHQAGPARRRGRAGRARARSGRSPRAGCSPTTEWRSVGDERRYLRSVRRSPNAAVFVAEDGEEIVGRLSIARDPHPASFHVADLGLMVAKGHRRRGIGRALLDAGRRVGARGRRLASSSSTSSRTTSPRSRSTRASASSARATAGATTGAPESSWTRC